MFTWDDKLIISLRNQGTQVRDNIDKTTKNAIKVNNLKQFQIKYIIKNKLLKQAYYQAGIKLMSWAYQIEQTSLWSSTILWKIVSHCQTY